MSGSIDLAPGVRVAESAIVLDAARSSGAGGQHVNKTASKILLRVPVSAIRGLPNGAAARLRQLAGTRLTGEDEVLIRCDETRSAHRNREIALQRLAKLVTKALVVPKRRRKTRPTRASVERRLEAKRQHADKKRRRRNPD